MKTSKLKGVIAQEAAVNYMPQNGKGEFVILQCAASYLYIGDDTFTDDPCTAKIFSCEDTARCYAIRYLSLKCIALYRVKINVKIIDKFPLKLPSAKQ